jgi:folylpolyglutamate synthase/dihydropteroate synthase
MALQEQARRHGLQGTVHPSVGDAFRSAQRVADKDDLLLVTGSVFVVAEVL